VARGSARLAICFSAVRDRITGAPSAEPSMRTVRRLSPFALCVFLSLLGACGSGSHPSEPLVAQAWLPQPNFDNPVAFGTTLANRPEYQAQAIAIIASKVNGRLPGVRFAVVHHPVHDESGNTCNSYRVTGQRPYICLGWYETEPGSGFQLVDVDWEVDHLSTNTDDFGSPVK
jgi:hypothetical protein